ncbi:MAG TPA: cysteine desulfurase [Chloroflexia bacterium]|nr:cysteine desulfurase [Chloroflexia bacterium]
MREETKTAMIDTRDKILEIAPEETNKATLDVASIRRDFPILEEEEFGKKVAYLDNGASSLRPEPVINAMLEYFHKYNANIHRGVYRWSEEATRAYEAAHRKVAKFINASPREIIFTRNTTESLNLVAYSWGRANVSEGDEIVTTVIEHHSNLVPWQVLAAEKNARLRYIPMTKDGQLDISNLNEIVNEKTKLVTFTHMSNVLGTISPVAQIVARAKEVGAVVAIDGAQSAPHMKVDVQALGCDFYAFSGHKMCGPTGIGVLWGRRELLEAMPPFLTGGDMIRDVTLERSTWNDLPWKFEAGTPSIAEGIGLGAAVDYLSSLGMENIRQHEIDLTAYALEKMVKIPDLTIYGPLDAQARGGIISFNLGDVHPHDLATMLDREAIAVRAGHHCCQPLIELLETTATTRASFYIYNTEEEVDRLVEALYKARKVFHLD